MQFRVLGFGLLQDWNVEVGVFPEGEEVFVSTKRSDAGSPIRRSRCLPLRFGSSHRFIPVVGIEQPKLFTNVPPVVERPFFR